MPHTGVIDESLDKQELLLMRARLHVRGSHVRFSEGHINDAVAAMYDAISSAMQSFATPDGKTQFNLFFGEDNPSDDKGLFRILKQSGVFDDEVSFSDFNYIAETLDKALESQLKTFDETRFIETAHRLLVQMGVLPYNLCELPDSVTL